MPLKEDFGFFQNLLSLPRRIKMFEVIGERINTSRKLVQAAVADRDAEYIIDDVKKTAGSWCRVH